MDEPKAGDPTNKLWETVADLCKRVKALENIKITPEGCGKVLTSEGNIVIALETTDKCPSP